MGILERALQSRGRDAGQPASAKTGFGTPTTVASRPMAMKASPAPAGAPVGRPGAPSSIASPSAPMPFPEPPSVSAPSTPSAPPSPGSLSPVQPVIQKTTTTTTPYTPPAPAPAAPTPRNFKTIPSAFDMKSLAPGEQAMTPWGPAVMDPQSGKAKIQFTPEGEQAYRRAVVAERKKMRVPLAFSAIMDSLPVTPGQSNYDPFSGKWS